MHLALCQSVSHHHHQTPVGLVERLPVCQIYVVHGSQDTTVEGDSETLSLLYTHCTALSLEPSHPGPHWYSDGIPTGCSCVNTHSGSTLVGTPTSSMLFGNLSSAFRRRRLNLFICLARKVSAIH